MVETVTTAVAGAAAAVVAVVVESGTLGVGGDGDCGTSYCDSLLRSL